MLLLDEKCARDLKVSNDISGVAQTYYKVLTGIKLDKTAPSIAPTVPLSKGTEIVTLPKGKDTGKTILVFSTESGEGTVSVEAKGLKSSGVQLNFVEKKRYRMHCGVIMPFTAKLCPKCGQAPPAGVDTKACKNCKAVIPVVAKFCAECGASQPE